MGLLDVNGRSALTAIRYRGSVADDCLPEHNEMTAEKKINLEKSLADLEAIVEELESGDLPLEKAMKKFEEGIKLTRGCQAALRDAEQKVDILLKSSRGEDALEQFNADNEQDD